MIKEFNLYLEQSETLRNGYTNSLLPKNNNWEFILHQVMLEIPEIFKHIYNRVSGTLYELENQKFMDFIPGFLLIHINEFEQDYLFLKNITNIIDPNEIYYPILRNYSSDFIAINKNNLSIYLIYHDDDEIHLIHQNSLLFFKTLNENYKENVYFLDEDGYLDYNPDLEYKIAKKINPDIDYWTEN